MKDMYPVKRTIVRNAVNVAQPGDLLHKSVVENLDLKVGDDDEADVLPVGADVPQVVFLAPEVRYDKPIIPAASPLSTTEKDDEKKSIRRPASKD